MWLTVRPGAPLAPLLVYQDVIAAFRLFGLPKLVSSRLFTSAWFAKTKTVQKNSDQMMPKRGKVQPINKSKVKVGGSKSRRDSAQRCNRIGKNERHTNFCAAQQKMRKYYSCSTRTKQFTLCTDSPNDNFDLVRTLPAHCHPETAFICMEAQCRSIDQLNESSSTSSALQQLKDALHLSFPQLVCFSC